MLVRPILWYSPQPSHLYLEDRWESFESGWDGLAHFILRLSVVSRTISRGRERWLETSSYIISRASITAPSKKSHQVHESPSYLSGTEGWYSSSVSITILRSSPSLWPTSSRIREHRPTYVWWAHPSPLLVIRKNCSSHWIDWSPPWLCLSSPSLISINTIKQSDVGTIWLWYHLLDKIRYQLL